MTLTTRRPRVSDVPLIMLIALITHQKKVIVDTFNECLALTCQNGDKTPHGHSKTIYAKTPTTTKLQTNPIRWLVRAGDAHNRRLRLRHRLRGRPVPDGAGPLSSQRGRLQQRRDLPQCQRCVVLRVPRGLVWRVLRLPAELLPGRAVQERRHLLLT